MTKSIKRSACFLTKWIVGFALVFGSFSGFAQCDVDLGTPVLDCSGSCFFNPSVIVPVSNAASLQTYELWINGIFEELLVEPTHLAIRVNQFNNADIDIQLRDQDDPSCTATLNNVSTECTLDGTECGAFDQCNFVSFGIDCTAQGNEIQLSDPVLSPSPDFVDVFVNGVFVQTVANQAGSTVAFDNAVSVVLGFYASGTDCGFFTDIELPDCNNIFQQCDIAVTAIPICSDDTAVPPSYFVELNWSAVSLPSNFDASSVFVVETLNFSFLTIEGTYGFNENSAMLGPFTAADGVNGFLVSILGTDYSTCGLQIPFTAPTCPAAECDSGFLWFDIESPTITCSPQGYELNIPATAGQDFDIYLDGVYFKTVLSQEITPVPIPVDGVSVEVSFFVPGTECGVIMELDLQECIDEECNVANLFAETYCDGQDTLIDFEFDAIGFENNFFDYSISGITGFLETGESFYTIVANLSLGIHVLTISENDNSDCYAEIAVNITECEVEPCVVPGLFAQASCDGENVSVFLEVDNAVFGYNSIQYFLAGITGGQEVGQTFYTIENVDLAPGVYPLTVWDSSVPTCSATISVTIPECSAVPENCELAISALGECDGEVYFVDLAWTGLNLPDVDPSWTYTINGNGTNYGTFPVGQTEAMLGPFTSDQTINEFVVTISGDGMTQCQGDTGFTPPQCGDGPCSINNLFAESYCLNGSPAIDFEFDPVGFTNDFIDYAIDGQTGFAEVGETFYTLDNLTPGTHVLTVSENDNSSCFAEFEVVIEACEEDDSCNISNVTATAFGCNDGSYSVLVDFDFENLPDGSTQFGINGNGNQYGTWNYADAPILLGPFTSDQTINEFVVFDTSLQNDCQNFAGFEAPNCSEDTNPVEIVSCDAQNVVLSVDPSGFTAAGSDNFWVSINPGGFSDGPHSLSGGPVLIDVAFAGTDCTIWEIAFVNEVNISLHNVVSTTVCPCTEGEVWPGDTNNDGVANNFDFLNIGLAYGNQGAQRPQASTSWFGQFCPNWVQNFVAGLNFKFADCNGDGVINGEDELAIDQNYGSLQGKTEGEEGTEDEAPLFVEIPDAPLSPGQAFSFPIKYGTTEDPVESAYGYAFSIEYDASILLNPEIIFNESWLGTDLIDARSFVKHFPNEARFEIAFSRIDQSNRSGFGTIGFVQGILIENVEGYHVGEPIPIDIDINNVDIINAAEEEVPFTLTPELGSITTGINANSVDVSVYPSPANDFIMLEMPSLRSVARINIINSTGQIVQSQKAEGSSQRIDLFDLSIGIYFIEIVDLETRTVRKIEVIK